MDMSVSSRVLLELVKIDRMTCLYQLLLFVCSYCCCCLYDECGEKPARRSFHLSPPNSPIGPTPASGTPALSSYLCYSTYIVVCAIDKLID